MWIPDREDNHFLKNYKKLSSILQQRTDEKIIELCYSEDPRKLGDHKTGRVKCLHACKLGRQYRILYDVIFKENTIKFLRVGTHDVVYD